MKFFLLLLLMNSASHAIATEKKLAVIWNGKGVCPFWCVKSSKEMAIKAGFRTIYVNSKTQGLSKILSNSSLWIQPGGKSLKASKAMGEKIRKQIREFVHSGGGYVGFCAGMLLTTNKIALTQQKGLGILPGSMNHLSKVRNFRRQPVILDIDLINGKSQSVYFSGGPFLEVAHSGVSVESYYSTGQISSVSASFGKGKVIVYGFHAETPRYWKKLRRLRDSDGNDYNLPIDMMKRAGKNFDL
jgi:glutamine amidotransferase-like uncharacterized protein